MAFTICTKSGFREAPPTRDPSMSGCDPKSLQLAAVTEPVKHTKVLKVLTAKWC